jgi:hypothetical protein
VEDDEYSADDLTIVDPGVVPSAPLGDEVTPQHVTDPSLLAIARGKEPGQSDEWLITFRGACLVRDIDLRRAFMAEMLARGSTKVAAEEMWGDILKRVSLP